MANGFFQEWKHYSIADISKELDTNRETVLRLIGILRKQGVVKVFPKEKSWKKGFSYQDIIYLNEQDENVDMEFVFDFVGIVLIGNYVFKCYPKYIKSTPKPFQEMKKVLKVIEKYNSKEDLLILHNGNNGQKTFHELSISLYLLQEYYSNGLYYNQQEIIETNGTGEILWEPTIYETFALIQNNRPYYIELQTKSTMLDDMDYIRRLHECILTQCSKKLESTGILPLFDIVAVSLTDAQLKEFGTQDYILYRLQQELRTQFVTRKQNLLKTLYTYIANSNTQESELSFSLYGTNSFQLVWEEVCKHNFGNQLKTCLKDLPTKLCTEYQPQKDKKLYEIIEKPIWWKYANHSNKIEGSVTAQRTLEPDFICIYPCGNQEYCFGIFDAKYYTINIDYDKTTQKGIITGQMGISDITKQYLYQLAYQDFIKKQGYKYVQNVFFCPQEEASTPYGYVELNMLHNINHTKLENIVVVKLCADEMYNYFLMDKQINNIEDYLPKPIY